MPRGTGRVRAKSQYPCNQIEIEVHNNDHMKEYFDCETTLLYLLMNCVYCPKREILFIPSILTDCEEEGFTL